MNFKLMILLLIPLTLAGCSKMSASRFEASSISSSSGNPTGPNPKQPGVPDPNDPFVAGIGSKLTGQGALSVPVGEALVSRIQNGLGISSGAGNFARALTQVRTNLPKNTDPTKATGFDQAQLLVYAACSDLTTGGANALMTTRYSVAAGGTIAVEQTDLVNAGVRMMDSYTAGLASTGPTSTQVRTAFTNLVNTIAGQAGATNTIAFMSVCIAANTAGSAMMGF